MLLKHGPGPWTLDPNPGPGPWTRTWTRTLDQDPGPWTLDPDPDPDPGPWTQTLKNLDPEKPRINIGLKNMSDFTQCELLFKNSCTKRYLN